MEVVVEEAVEEVEEEMVEEVVEVVVVVMVVVVEEGLLHAHNEGCCIFYDLSVIFW